MTLVTIIFWKNSRKKHAYARHFFQHDLTGNNYTLYNPEGKSSTACLIVR